MKKRNLINCILAFTLALSVILSSLVFIAPVTVSAEETEIKVWDGTKAESFAGGDGSAATPFLIETPEQLYKMLMEYSNATASNGVYFEITKDIYLNEVADGTHVKDLETKENWLKEYGTDALPTGSKTNAFAGHLNGKGHTIYGLYTSGAGRSGLFHTIIQGTTIKNLSFENVYLVGPEGYGGAIAGRAHWVNGKSVAEITNCSVTKADIGGNMQFAGGLLGNQNDCNINYKNCYSYDVTLTNWAGSGLGGGIFGNIDHGSSNKATLTNCYSAGNFIVNSKVNKTNGSITFVNSYTNVAVPEGCSETDVAVLNDADMKGDAAKTNMALDYRWTYDTKTNSYPVFKDEIIEVWDGTTKATSFDQFKGTGTIDDPYQIENAAQLAYVVATKNLAKQKYYELVKDIRINDTAIPNWKDSAKDWVWENFRFEGTIFEGNGHIIDGLYFKKRTDDKIGLFPYVGDTTIRNIHFTNASVNKTSGYGAGIVAGQTSASANFENIYIDETCEINAPTIQGVGALTAYGPASGTVTVNVRNCAVLANIVTTTGKSQGAFIGHYPATANVNIYNSFSAVEGHVLSGDPEITSLQHSYALVGDAYGTTVLTADQMKGENAKTSMPTLSFKYMWDVVDNGYPVMNIRKEVWNGSTYVTSHDNFKGDGTETDPYLIENGAQLYYAAIGCGSNLNDGSYYKLANDIILNDSSLVNWESFAHPWGMNKAKRFNGTLDGDGHTIEGLYINTDVADGRYGLFSYVGQDSGNKIAELKNITFNGASINHTTTSTSFRGVAVVAGQASGKTNFENIYVDETCKVNAPNVNGVAGIVAHNYNNSSAHVTISNSAVLATINGAGGVGAFAGRLNENTSIVVTINDSFAATNVGLVGSCNGTVTINNAYSNVVNSVDKGATQVDAANMKGKAAMQNMPKLDFFFVWKTVENGYPVLRYNDEKLEAWDGSVATALEGEGTKANPYKISNGAELYYMVSAFSNVAYDTVPETIPYFEITADINLGCKQWYAVASSDAYANASNYSNGFNGIILGNGHYIYNLYNGNKVATAGLIPVATQGTEIHDLHLKGGSLAKIDWYNYVAGGFIGLAAATNNSVPTILKGCSVEDTVIGSRDASGALVGISQSQSLIFKDCYAINNNLSHTSTKTNMNHSAFVAVHGEGNGEGNSVVIENCYTDTSANIGYVRPMSTTYKNVYTADEEYDRTIDGLTQLTADIMKGDAARENLDGFNFNTVWKVVEGGYPVHEDLENRSMYWDGSVADGFAGGKGTEAEPYIITNAKELYLLATLDRETTLGKFYKLGNDISISAVYEDWGNDNPYTWAVKKAYLDGFTYTSSFAGTLDGAGYTVSGLYYNNAIVDGGNYAYGLIPFVTADAVIKNITVSDVSANVLGDGAYVGAVAGAAHVMKEDIENTLLHAVQFVGVNTKNVAINAANKGDILGGASYGVKFEICSTETDNIHGEIKDYFVEVDCNNDTAYNKDIVIVNTLNMNDAVLATIRAILLGNDTITKMATLDMNASFDICDLVTAKRALEVKAPEEYLVWSDEFNGNALNTSVWTQSNSSIPTGKNLKYTDTATFDGNNIELNIRDSGETIDGNPIYNINYGLHTANTMSYKYGRLEMRAKIPVGAGAFPALWLSSRDAIGYDKYSKYSNEIDVFEVFGEKAGANTAVACIHKWYNDADGTKNDDDEQCSCGTGAKDGNGYKIEESDRSKNISYDWYIVEFEWTVDTMYFWIYKDGESRPAKPMYTATKDDMDNKKSFDINSLSYVTGFDLKGFETSNEGIFNQFMYPIITNHMYTVGNTTSKYTGSQSEIDANLANLTYEIDYIRLYQKNDGKSEINLK